MNTPTHEIMTTSFELVVQYMNITVLVINGIDHSNMAYLINGVKIFIIVDNEDRVTPFYLLLLLKVIITSM